MCAQYGHMCAQWRANKGGQGYCNGGQSMQL